MPEPVYMLLSSANNRAGGVTRNVLHRARLLADKVGATVTILTTEYAPECENDVRTLRESGLLTDGVATRNFFAEIDPTSRTDSHSPAPDLATDIDCQRWVFRDGPALSRVFSPPAQDVPPPSTGTRRLEADSAGIVHTIEYLDGSGPKPYQTLYLDAFGRCYLALFSDPESGRSQGAFHFDERGALIASYSSIRDLQAHWLSSIISAHESVTVFSDWRHADAVSVRATHPCIARIKTLHINHLEEPRTYGSAIRPRSRIELGRIGLFDAVVMLTDSQKRDIARQFGPRSTYHVVPNPTVTPRLNGPVERDPFLVVGIGRYHEFKGWDHAIRAFRLVVDRVPQAKLQLWGHGPEEQSLRDLIEQLGLSQNVTLMGIAENSHRALAGAALSVLTSPAEAFGLVTSESMAVGTPMVAFDVTYGLRDQITSGVDGVLVPHPDIEALADALVDLLSHPKKRLAMGKRALKSKKRTSESQWIERWLDVIEAAREQRAHRSTIDEPSAACTSLQLVRTALAVGATVEFAVAQPEDVSLQLHARCRDPFGDAYGTVAAATRNGDFHGSLPLNELHLTPGTTWDLYVSCSARNAHRFARMSGMPEAPVRLRLNWDIELKPYLTQKGNLSFKVIQPAGAPLWVRAARRIRRAFAGASAK